jgi:predicted RNase H-like HicB family nuclease
MPSSSFWEGTTGSDTSLTISANLGETLNTSLQRNFLYGRVFRSHVEHNQRVTFTVESEQESDGRWIAEIPQIPGAMSYGSTRDEPIKRVEALGLRVRAERIEQGEISPEIQQVFTVAAA